MTAFYHGIKKGLPITFEDIVLDYSSLIEVDVKETLTNYIPAMGFVVGISHSIRGLNQETGSDPPKGLWSKGQLALVPW